jgi:hypothetical protein
MNYPKIEISAVDSRDQVIKALPVTVRDTLQEAKQFAKELSTDINAKSYGMRKVEIRVFGKLIFDLVIN